MSTFATVLRRLAAFTAIVFAGFAVLFVGGYALDDPGGWAGAGILAMVAVPAVVLAWVARRHREKGAWLVRLGLVLLVGYAVTGSFVRLVDAPVLAVAAVVLAVPVAVLGLREARSAGLLMLAVGATPLVGMLLEQADGGRRGFHLGGSSGAAAVPLLVCAVLFLVAAAAEAVEHHGRRTPTVQDWSQVAH